MPQLPSGTRVKIGTMTYLFSQEDVPFAEQLREQHAVNTGARLRVARQMYPRVMGRWPQEGAGEILAHLNGNARDFTRSNLSASTRKERCAPNLLLRDRTPRPEASITPLQSGKYRVRIFRGKRKPLNLGSHDTLERARHIRMAYLKGATP